MNGINKKIQQLKEMSLYRDIKYLSEAQYKYTTIDNKPVMLMASNNYLGLSNNNLIKKAAIESIKYYGVGSGGSRLTTGSYNVHRKLEKKIATFKNCEDCLIFNNGYMANVGVISSICDEEFTIFSDELNHASIIDGCRLSKAKVVVYKHNDMMDLSNKVKLKKSKYGVIVTDSVFSMDGDIANLIEIVNIAKDNKLMTIVDDAHATGVIGEKGKGSCEYFNIKDIDIIIGTLSKAIGSEGGFVCANSETTNFLRNKARSFIFSTALSPSVVSASIKSIEIIEKNPELIKKLNENIEYFCEKLGEIGFKVKSNTPIVPIIIGNEDVANEFSKKLLEEGVFIPAIRYPTVKKGEARLRATLMATHTFDDIDFAIKKIQKVNEFIKINTTK
ncbi:8-amino-7-oxononanoate synthase [Paraclostridium bifermentans]|uniref:8-amino-7-oxononanoate synthase n=1 Tax=Paraclostridium bifermentans TaxID=1490 RepID=UPI002911F9BE|nr:8-amino-7-oxononanoate synthase [Paraclostridium bifermentans]MDU3803286.1 8-amino-7-oxononanoate synthase [Paraclostridium bifermentans]